MIRITWQDISFEVTRLIVSEGLGEAFRAALDPVVERFGLVVADESAEPRPGDFWIGCSPRGGWQDADPGRTAWASGVEVREAIVCLSVSLPRHRRVALAPSPGVTRLRQLFTVVRPAAARTVAWV
jgi:hypothetical protein